MSGVYQGLKEAPGIYNKRVTFCKIYFTYFARDKWSDHDFENCSEIRRVTRIRKTWVQSQILRQWLEIKALQGSKTTSAFCKIRLPNFAQDESSNHDSKNCSEISAVTWFRIWPVLLHFPNLMFITPPYCRRWGGGGAIWLIPQKSKNNPFNKLPKSELLKQKLLTFGVKVDKVPKNQRFFEKLPQTWAVLYHTKALEQACK